MVLATLQSGSLHILLQQMYNSKCFLCVLFPVPIKQSSQNQLVPIKLFVAASLDDIKGPAIRKQIPQNTKYHIRQDNSTFCYKEHAQIQSKRCPLCLKHTIPRKSSSVTVNLFCSRFLQMTSKARQFPNKCARIGSVTHRQLTTINFLLAVMPVAAHKMVIRNQYGCWKETPFCQIEDIVVK